MSEAKAQIRFLDQHVHAFGEFTVAVRYEGDVFRMLVSFPGVHDEGVVHGDAKNAVDAVLLEYAGQFVVARQVARRTGRRERARQRENNDGFVFEQVISGHINPLVALTGVESNLRNFLAFLTGKH